MKFKKIHFIINPVAGTKAPILPFINKVFSESAINWEVSFTQKNGDAFRIAKLLKGKTDLIAVYGGDGSLSEVAGALYGSNTPMAIIPGGTANVMAKELGIPLDRIDALGLLKNNRPKFIKIDMGVVNKHPFMIRVNLGVMADMIILADQNLKDNLGQLAYGLTAIKSLANAQSLNYKLLIDGKKIHESGVALTITNFGGIGIGSFDLLPGISINDGLLDVILLNNAGIVPILRVAGSTLTQNDSDVLKHWKCREVVVIMDKSVHYICDDFEKKAKRLSIKVIPKALKILVPAASLFD
jgi:YegS/Rv2252/BmrU family lipid kinase